MTYLWDPLNSLHKVGVTVRLVDLIQQTVSRFVLPTARVKSIMRVPVTSRRGWSGSIVRRYHVQLTDDSYVSFIVKTMLLKERLVMNFLCNQGHKSIPYTHSLDMESSFYQPSCMQDIRGRVTTEFDNVKAIKGKVASALSKVHVRNMGFERPDWLPPLDLKSLMIGWQSSWSKALSNSSFEREFGVYTTQLEQAAQRFLRSMAAFRAESEYSTLVHGDMLPPAFDHVVISNGEPFFIDWGSAQFDSFYLDLPCYFSPQDVMMYRDQLICRGFDISVSDFMERYLEAGRYVGFKYLKAGLKQWSSGPTKYTGKLLLIALRMAIKGTIPKPGFSLTGKDWRFLLSEHNQLIGG